MQKTKYHNDSEVSMLRKKLIKYLLVFFIIISSTIVLPNTQSFASFSNTELNAIADVLLNKAEFFDTDGSKNVYLNDFLTNFDVEDGCTAKAIDFAVFDLDGDGMPEIVLEMQYGGDGFYEVFRYTQGKVYGYNLVYRAMENLQKDGSFIGSGGAADNYICKLRFLGDACDTEELIWSESDLDGSVLYFDHDVSIDEDTFYAYCGSLKNDAVRYKFTQKNTKKWVANYPDSLITKPFMPAANIADRQKYLDSLSYLFSDSYKDIYSNDSKVENDRAIKSYKAWDIELNKIYQMLKKKLSASDMQKLRTEERQWIKICDDRAEQVFQEWSTDTYGKEYADGMRNKTLRDITRRRTYQLIDLYYCCKFYD